VASDLYRYVATFLGWGAFVAGCLVWGVLVIPATLLLSRFWPRAPLRFEQTTRVALRLYIRSLLFLRLRVEGSEQRLAGPRIIVANHQSWLDPIVLIALGPRLSGPAQSYLFRVSVVRSFLRLAGFYVADAGEASSLEGMHRVTEATREQGSALLFFPEGTRSRTGEVGPFHRGAFRLAVDHDLPIQPIVIDGLDRILPPGHWIARVPGRPLVRVRYLEPLRPPFGTGIRRDVVRALGLRVRARLVEELERLRSERA
jgi:1-acyl-sn-glycerol-3-phosphate acyltransferase